MANSNLTEAQRAKNDEFYTQYHDIEKEISAYLEFNPDVFRGKTLPNIVCTRIGHADIPVSDSGHRRPHLPGSGAQVVRDFVAAV